MQQAVATRPTLDELVARACRLAAEPGLWAPFVRSAADERHFVPLAHDLPAWVITWAPSTGLTWHDHDEAEGAVVVVRGALVERWTSACQPGVRTRTLA